MRSLLLASVFAMGATALAQADTPGSDWISKAEVTKKLEGLGYTDIRKLKADDGHWEGNATKGGKVYEIHVDPHSGKLTKNKPKDED